MRGVSVAFFTIALAAAIASACGDDASPATSEPDASTDATSDRSTGDGDGGDDADAGDLGCRTAAAPSAKCAASPDACERKTLYISSSSTYPFAIVTDEANVYWVAGAAYDGTAAASILRVSKTGASTQQATVLAQNQSRTTTLVRDGADLYWIASEANDAGGASTLRRLAGATGSPQDVATFSGLAERLVRVAPGVFFTVDAQGDVRRLTKDGGVMEIDKTSTTPALATSKDVVFAGGGKFERVDVMPSGGGSPSTFFALFDAGPDGATDAALPGAHVLGADCDRMFGIRDDVSALFWSPVATSGYHSTAALFDGAEDIISDEGFVYVARRKGGGVERGTRDGSGFASVYVGDVWRLAVDDDGIYWGEHAKGALAGNVFMQTKK
jgi:hypothetical protein